jgi:23S rRNA pseudouridine2605 synthase
VRLNAYLARAGVASRRKADELIKAGRVTVNGEPGQLNTFVQARDRVEVDGRIVLPREAEARLLARPRLFPLSFPPRKNRRAPEKELPPLAAAFPGGPGRSRTSAHGFEVRRSIR